MFTTSSRPVLLSLILVGALAAADQDASAAVPKAVQAGAVVAAPRAVEMGPPVPDWRAQSVMIDNGKVRVVADPLHGGRLVAYGPEGGNILQNDEAQHPDWIFPHNDHWTGPAGGRFDIGPEDTLPDHRILWTDAYAIERVDALHLRLTSEPDPVSGLQLVREFILDADSTHLRCTQTMRNITDHELRRSYWGRSLIQSGGYVVLPVNPASRFPLQFIACESYPDNLINLKPKMKDTGTTIRDGYAIIGPQLKTKLGFDGNAGWFAYLMPKGGMFVKRYAVYPERRYADVAGLTAAVFSDGTDMLEIEPLSPEEVLALGASASFSEDWWLLPYAFPDDAKNIDPVAIAGIVATLTAKP